LHSFDLNTFSDYFGKSTDALIALSFVQRLKTIFEIIPMITIFKVMKELFLFNYKYIKASQPNGHDALLV